MNSPQPSLFPRADLLPEIDTLIFRRLDTEALTNLRGVNHTMHGDPEIKKMQLEQRQRSALIKLLSKTVSQNSLPISEECITDSIAELENYKDILFAKIPQQNIEETRQQAQSCQLLLKSEKERFIAHYIEESSKYMDDSADESEDEWKLEEIKQTNPTSSLHIMLCIHGIKSCMIDQALLIAECRYLQQDDSIHFSPTEIHLKETKAHLEKCVMAIGEDALAEKFKSKYGTVDKNAFFLAHPELIAECNRSVCSDDHLRNTMGYLKKLLDSLPEQTSTDFFDKKHTHEMMAGLFSSHQEAICSYLLEQQKAELMHLECALQNHRKR